MLRSVAPLRNRFSTASDLWHDGNTAAHIRDWARGKGKDFILKELDKKLDRLRNSDCDIGAHVYETVIQLYAKFGLKSKAIDTYRDSKDRWPTAARPAIAICRMFAKSGDTDKVIQVLQDINSWGYALDDRMRQNVIILCSRRMYSSLAVRTLADCDEITISHVLPTVLSLKCFKHAQQLLETLSSNYYLPTPWSVHVRRAVRSHSSNLVPYDNCTDGDVILATESFLKFVPFHNTTAVEEASKVLSALATLPGYSDLSISMGLSILKNAEGSSIKEGVAASVINCCGRRHDSQSSTACRRSDAELAWKLSNKAKLATCALLHFYATIPDRAAVETLFRELGSHSEEVRRAYIEACISAREDSPFPALTF
eukprot:TRINITY_DN14916_c0_g1_i1.p1 TRINITY_DN14916_c0_g1~~TRINITY_DN14916_c0_g1_i1.p1  ORF type:complete len:370 (+),score=43.24 TRINITY_DN14916_c0_g1_i1:43-1152(+)